MAQEDKYLNERQTTRLWAKIKAYVTNAIGGITSVSFVIVQTLPATGVAGAIYLVPNSGSSPNIYDEYIYVANAWEKIGTTEIDLSGYVQTSRKINNKALSADITLSASDVGALPSSTTIPTASTTNPSMDGTASYGSGTSYARSNHVHPTDTSRQAKITASGLLKGDGSGGVSAATAGTDYAAASHSHGNITSGGDITATAPTIASGDQLVINDNSASKITNGPTFDGSTTTKALTPKGTWETFLTLATLPVYDGTVV